VRTMDSTFGETSWATAWSRREELRRASRIMHAHLEVAQMNSWQILPSRGPFLSSREGGSSHWPVRSPTEFLQKHHSPPCASTQPCCRIACYPPRRISMPPLGIERVDEDT
jgi:hypothetical protein